MSTPTRMPPLPSIPDDPQVRNALRNLAERTLAQFNDAAKAFQPLIAALNRSLSEAFAVFRRDHVTLWAIATGPEARRHRRHCVRCTPAYRRPLPVDGHAYARRRRARTRRGRR